MEHPLYQVIEQYGIYAVFALCTIEGDIHFAFSGVLAHSGFFGRYSFFKVLLFGTPGGMAGDIVSYFAGRSFAKVRKALPVLPIWRNRVSKPDRKIRKLRDRYFQIYLRHPRSDVFVLRRRQMPFWRFLWLDAISCGLWVLLLSGAGYFFSGAVTSIIGDFQQIGIALFFIVLTGVVVFYVVERFWLSEKVEEANPKTIAKIEERILAVEGAPAEQRLHTIGERLHLTREAASPGNGGRATARDKKGGPKISFISGCNAGLSLPEETNKVIIESSAPTRVDLAGGTIDIPPLFLFHEGSCTVNFAIDLLAKCRIETRDDRIICLESIDRGLKVRDAARDRSTNLRTSRGSSSSQSSSIFSDRDRFQHGHDVRGPGGRWACGSSTLNIACIGALNKLVGDRYPARSIYSDSGSGRMSGDQGADGYQDYYSAQYGGVSCIHFGPGGMHERN